MLFRRRARLSVEGRRALVRVLEAPTFELIPLRNALDQAARLPAGARISITASPAKGMAATLELSEGLARAGFVPIPHLSARMIRDRAHLAEVLARLASAGIDRAFVVGGDEKDPGAFSDGLALLRAMEELGGGPADIGIPCYPEGHAFIADRPLLAALAAKAPFATSMTSQLCFDPGAIATFLAARRSEGLELPVHIGLPGVAEPQKLLAIAARIGVADTHRYLTKNLRFVTRLIRSGGYYRPDGLLEGLAPHVADPSARVAGLHIYTFNAVEVTEAWRARYLERLGRESVDT
jgi:methylenetetrahydrofolate reductase (NADPH)